MLDRLGGSILGLRGSDDELIAVVATSLVLFMIGTYLLITRGTWWHVAAGGTIAGIAVLYLLEVADIITVERIWNGWLWAEAMRWVGIG